MNDESCDLLCLEALRAEAIRVGQPGVEVAREAAERASMFSDPTRLMLAEALGEGGERRGSGGRLDRPPDVGRMARSAQAFVRSIQVPHIPLWSQALVAEACATISA